MDKPGWGPEPCWGCGSTGEHPTLGGHYWPCGTMKCASIRGEACYEAQLTAQSALLNECLDVVRVVGNTFIDMGSIHPDGLPAKYLSAYEGMLLFGPKATALLPRLEKVVGEGK